MPLALVGLAACSGGGGGDTGSAEVDGTVERPDLGRPTAAEVPLEVGQCGDVPSLLAGQALDPSTIAPAACGTAHVLEVIAVLDYPAERSVPFPGVDAVDGYAEDRCIERFEAYVGRPYVESVLDVVIVAPGEDGWGRGDRRIACLAYHTNFELVTGSVEGTGI